MLSIPVDRASAVFLLLLALAALALLVLRARRLSARQQRRTQRADELLGLSGALSNADKPLDRAPDLQRSLNALARAPCTLLLLHDLLPAADDMAAATLLGTAHADPLAGLWLSLREGRAFGPGTGRHEQQGAWYLPMRGRRGSLGAARLVPAHGAPGSPEGLQCRAHAQALCDQMGLALERAQAVRSAARMSQEAQSHKLRNTLLAAISHDYRTPLATILGAASALQEQGERLSVPQRRRLADSIVREVEQLGRLTDNTLQLARLDAPGLALRLDWESAEEIVGAVLRRFRSGGTHGTHGTHRTHGTHGTPGTADGLAVLPAAFPAVQARVEPGLPLLRCDAVLLVQMLDNLVDNALKHGQAADAVEVLVRQIKGEIVIAVRDRGPGVPPAWRERIFEVFQRGEGAPGRGVGVGLAVCRAIARAHGGELVYRPRGHGGASFECHLPIVPAPPLEGAE